MRLRNNVQPRAAALVLAAVALCAQQVLAIVSEYFPALKGLSQ